MIKYEDNTILKMTDVDGTLDLAFKLGSIDKYNLSWFIDLIKLCNKYLLKEDG